MLVAEMVRHVVFKNHSKNGVPISHSELSDVVNRKNTGNARKGATRLIIKLTQAKLLEVFGLELREIQRVSHTAKGAGASRSKGPGSEREQREPLGNPLSMVHCHRMQLWDPHAVTLTPPPPPPLLSPCLMALAAQERSTVWYVLRSTLPESLRMNLVQAPMKKEVFNALAMMVLTCLYLKGDEGLMEGADACLGGTDPPYPKPQTLNLNPKQCPLSLFHSPAAPPPPPPFPPFQLPASKHRFCLCLRHQKHPTEELWRLLKLGTGIDEKTELPNDETAGNQLKRMETMRWDLQRSHLSPFLACLVFLAPPPPPPHLFFPFLAMPSPLPILFLLLLSRFFSRFCSFFSLVPHPDPSPIPALHSPLPSLRSVLILLIFVPLILVLLRVSASCPLSALHPRMPPFLLPGDLLREEIALTGRSLTHLAPPSAGTSSRRRRPPPTRASSTGWPRTPSTRLEAPRASADSSARSAQSPTTSPSRSHLPSPTSSLAPPHPSPSMP